MRKLILLVSILTLCAAPAREARPAGTAAPTSAKWATNFPVDKADLSSTGRNPYFVLEPGHYVILRGGHEELKSTVLHETRMIDGVETRIVEEYETSSGDLAEISRNYFAISRKTGDVYYFGEEVDVYKQGKVVGHGGTWHSGSKGARFGLMMPGRPARGIRHYQEQAPRIAMDRAEIVSTTAAVKTPAGEFLNCVKVAETSPMIKGAAEYKYYGERIGLIKYEAMELVDYGKDGVSHVHKKVSD